MGTLYVVGIPAGNREDVTLRALRVLREVDLIVAQDIPWAQAFLAHYEIETSLTHYAGHYGESEKAGMARSEFVSETLSSGRVALLFEESRAATWESARQLVRVAAERDCTVVAVPGPSAAATALVASGLPADAYVFLGVLPRRATERRQLLGSLAAEKRTLVACEKLGQLSVALCDIAETLGDRPLALSPVWVGPAEMVWRGTVSEAAAHLEMNPALDEWILVIGGATGEAIRWPETRVRSEFTRLLADGLSRKDTARQVAEVSGWRPREVYRLAQEDGFTFEAS